MSRRHIFRPTNSNDTITGSEHSDFIFTRAGDDLIDAGAGNDLIHAGRGDDRVQGGAGRDFILGGNGADTLDGGAGSDTVLAGNGDDTLIFTLEDGSSTDGNWRHGHHESQGHGRGHGHHQSPRPDFYDGGNGEDTLVINLTAAQYADPALQAELAAFLDRMEAGPEDGWIRIDGLNLMLRRIEHVTILVDGDETDPRDPVDDGIIARDDAFSTGENAPLTGDTSTNDTAPQGAVFSLLSNVSRGTLILGPEGGFSFDPGTAFDDLAEGETAIESFTYQIASGGSSATATATITITGTNDAPTVSGGALTVAEDGPAALLDLATLAADIDSDDDPASLSYAITTPPAAGLATLSGSALSFDPAGAFEALAEGETTVVTLGITVTDSHGASATAQVTITLTGTNDTPTVAAALAAGAQEDDAAFTLDLLQGAADIDSGALLSIANVTGLTPGVTLSGTSLTVDPAHAAFQPLAEGETHVMTITYDVTDEHGATAAQTATITLTGTNDTPTVAAALSATVAEDAAPITIDLLQGAADVDHGRVLSVAMLDPLPAGFALSGNSLVVTPADPAFQSLNIGDSIGITLHYAVTDEHGASAPQSVTVTVTGENDTPTVAAALTASVSEDSPAPVLDLLAGASDVDDGAVISVQNMAALPAGFGLSGNSLTVDTSHAAYQSLDDGESASFLLDYEIVDEHGAAVPQSIEVEITGANDAPVVSGAVTGTTNEDETTFTLDLLANASDIDASDVLNLASLAQTAGRALPFSTSGPMLTVDPSGFQDLALGESATVSFSYDVTDGDETAAATATITIEGRNDAPFVTASLGLQTALSGNGFSYSLPAGLFADVDASDTLTLAASAEGGLPAWLGFDAGTGTFSGTPPAGAALTYVTVTATDPHGASAEASFWLAQGDAVIMGTPDDDALTGQDAFSEIFIGLENNDILIGEDRSDIYVVIPGHGTDVIRDQGFTDFDMVLFDGLAPSDVEMRQMSPGSTDLGIWHDGELLAVIENTLNRSSVNQIEQLAFGDGSVMSMDDVRLLLIAQQSTPDDDRIFGFSDNGTITGGTGDDLLTGNDGSDTYVFHAGDGKDTVIESGFTDTDQVRFEGIASTDIAVSTVPGDRNSLMIEYGTGDSVLVHQGLNSSVNAVEEYHFTGDNVTLTIADMRALLIAQEAAAGDDSLIGWSNSADTLEGGAGDDYLSGGDGSDTYIFNSGDGRDRIYDGGFTDLDRVIFSDYQLSDATFLRLPGDLNTIVIRFANGDEVTLASAFDGNPTPGIEQVIFQGSGADETLTPADIRAMIYAAEMTAGDDTIIGTNQTETLEGGPGNDYLNAGDASDIYVFSAGDGRDRIYDSGFQDSDVLRIAGYDSTDASFYWREGAPGTLILSLPGGDEIMILNQTSLNGAIESFAFDDATLTKATVEAAADAAVAPWSVIAGAAGVADTLSGDGGWDILTGLSGADTYEFDPGDGRVEIEDNGASESDQVIFTGHASTDATFARVAGDSDDLFITFAGGDELLIRNGIMAGFGDGIESLVFTDQTLAMAAVRAMLISQQQTAGDDTVTGFDGADEINGSTGDDVLSGGRGSDTYLYAAGDGADRISDLGTGGADRLVISGYSIADMTVRAVLGSPSDVILDFGGGDRIEIIDALTNSFAGEIESIEFTTGGVTLDEEALRNILMENAATAGDDEINGRSGNETITGGLGDDRLIGGGGSDTYRYSFGDGQDWIADHGTGGADLLEIGGVASTDASFTRNTGDLNAVTIGFSDGGSIYIANTLGESFADEIETITFTQDAVSYEMAALRAILLAQETTAGNDVIVGFGASDTITGGQGDDVLIGLGGSDTFVFFAGDGDDIVEDRGTGNLDVLDFQGRTMAEATFSAFTPGSADLLVEFANGDSVLVIDGAAGGFANAIEEFHFTDGTLGLADVQLLI